MGCEFFYFLYHDDLLINMTFKMGINYKIRKLANLILKIIIRLGAIELTLLIDKCRKLYDSSQVLSVTNTKAKNDALKQVAYSLREHQVNILNENNKDIQYAIESGTRESLLDRLLLNESRMDDIIEGISTVIELKDPIWKSNEVWTLENGLIVSKMTVPLGVIGIIYESRPNVTIDAFSLALKSGNCILLRGSSTAINTNRALVYAVKEGLKKSKVSEHVIGFIDDVDKNAVLEMITLNKYIDLVIPRGGKELIDFVVKNATVPTIETGIGNCHIFVDDSADYDKALNIIMNAKIQRPGVCNSCETILVHENIAHSFLPKLEERLRGKVEMRGCDVTKAIIKTNEATEQDWYEEYLDYIVAVKVVKNVQNAMAHINKYGSKHSEAIITEHFTNANLFTRNVDAAAVYVNASTRFTDGGQLGFGAEMGISTQKIHARGPLGINQLVTVKYCITGNGQIRE